jgi:hypothetical protein
MKYLILLGLSVISNLYAFSQENNKLPVSGNKSLSIDANPFFNYAGNFFNNSTDNRLNLSSANIIYRKFKEDGKVFRLRGSAAIRLNSNALFTISPLGRGVEEIYVFNPTVGIGKEKRLNRRNWQFYGGWEFIAGVNMNIRNYKYDINRGDNISQNFSAYDRPKYVNNGIGITAGAGAVLGTEYYFSKFFFAGIDLVLPMTIGYRFQGRIVNQALSTSFQSPGFIQVQESRSTIPGGVNVEIMSASQLGFRVGFLF